MGRCLSLAWLGIALLWAAEVSALEPSGGFTLETGSPDALCPALEATREIVARRLGSLVVEGRKGWLARYTIGHAPEGNPRDFVRLELFNPEGAVELRRDLPIEGDSCRTMSEVIALVLDRYFRGLGANGAREATDVNDEPSPVATPAPQAEPNPQSDSNRPPIAVQAHAAPTPPTGVFGRGLRTSFEYTASFGQPSWAGRFSEPFASNLEASLAVRFGLTSVEEREPRGASVQARSTSGRASLAWRLAVPPGLLHVGPVLSLQVQQATTHGLPSQTDRTRGLWTTGLEAGFVVPIAGRVFIEGATSLDFLIPGTAGQFLIDNREVLAPRSVTFSSTLGLGFVWGGPITGGNE